MAQIPFTKLVGTGNDFVVVDARSPRMKAARNRWAEISRGWCDRRNGIGADGVLVLEPSTKADVALRVFNPDGSEAQMCGNGARCVALYLSQQRRGTAKPVTMQTLAGVISAQVRASRVSIRMTDPTELRAPFTLDVEGQPMKMGFVNTGVPHLVVPVDALQSVDVQTLGRRLRNHPHFAPRGTNVDFIQADARHPNRIDVRTYERGVEQETPACGTGVAAAAVLHAVQAYDAGLRRRVRRKIEVGVRSGDSLRVSLELSSNGHAVNVANVVLEGPAKRVFDGVAEWPIRRG